VSFKGKVAVLPCTGIGQVVGTIARQAAYRVVEDLRPEETVLLCLPALVRGVQEDLDMVADCPVVVIEGCKERCASHALSTRGRLPPAAVVFIPEAMKGSSLKIRREARRSLTEAENAVVELVAGRVAAEVDRLKGGMDRAGR
jgi:uncharacterized metal-binding protein